MFTNVDNATAIFAIANETDKDGDGISFCPNCDVIDAEFLGEQLID
ncbi:hypothetical protein QUF84_13160 [Fictibacillus enclensis]|nr:hypothetical protein [Fictibacillus enclensis]MDM5338171.1 hypothetical protein [Fictibacillus enclensis]